MELVLVVVAIAIILGVLFVILKKKKADKGSVINPSADGMNSVSQTKVSEKEIVPIEVQKRRALLRINLLVRTDSQRDEEVIELVENIISGLLKIINKLNADYANSELTFVMNNVVDEYLPNTLKGYLNLSPEYRRKKKPKLIESLGKLQERIISVVDKVQKQDASSFNTEAQFMKSMVGSA